MKQLLPIMLLVLLASCGGPGTAEVEPYMSALPVEYAVRLPDDYDPAESYPVLIALHGYDRNETQPTVLWDAGFFFTPDFILLAVRAPFEAGTGYDWFREPEEGEDRATARRRSARTGEEMVLAALDDFELQYLADPDHRMILGLGQGASIAAWVALRNHDLFGDLALFGRPDLELAAAAGPVQVDDFDVFIAGPEETARPVEDFFQAAGAQTHRFELPGPAVSAAALRAMQNRLDISVEPAPEDNLGYDEDGEPVPGERLQPADWGDEL